MADETYSSKAVPKFTSFRPKPAPAVSDSGDGRDKSQKTSVSGRSHHDHGSRSHRWKRERTPDHPHETRTQRHEISSPGRQSNNTTSHRSRDYVIDIRGDEDNLKYGSLHKYSVPPYRRTGFGHVLGLSLKQKIDRDLTTDKRIVIPDRHFSDGSRRDRDVFSKVGIQKEARIKRSLLEPPADINADFLPFTDRNKLQNQAGGRRDHGVDSPEDSDDAHYRSIKGKAKAPARPDDLDLEFNGARDSLKQGADSEALHTVKEQKNDVFLSQGVETEPENGQAWLDLIEHQGSRYEGFRMSGSEVLSLADIKLSMIEKALCKVKDAQFREILLSKMMHEGSKLWETSRISRKWTELLSKDPGFVSLWSQYIDFQQTSFTTFRYEELQMVFSKALEALGKVPSSTSSEIQCYILLRATLCMRESGFMEQAIAIWQAVLEFNFFRPHSGLLAPQCTSDFEAFWDSELPRVGESTACGWHQFKPGDCSALDTRVDPQKPLLENGNPASWSKLEREISEQTVMPARTLDEVGEDDPYRVILFSDVEPFMINIDASKVNFLLSAFLAFCGLPPMADIPANVTSWWWDSFVRNEGLRGITETLYQPSPSGDAQQEPAFQYPAAYCVPSIEKLFPKFGSWFLTLKQSRIGPSIISWVRNVLSAIVERRFGGDALSEYFLAFEADLFPDGARKTAKALLKQQPSSLRLYNAYALIEYRDTRQASAATVLATTINLSKENAGTVLLWKTWVLELLETEGPEVALARLGTIVDRAVKTELSDEDLRAPSSNKARILRTYRYLTDSRDHLLSIGDYPHALHHIELLILLQYLSNPSSSLDSALSAFASNTPLISTNPNLPPTSPIHELLHQFRAQLIDHHITHTPIFSSSTIRAPLLESVTLFPQNTVFLTLFSHTESRFRIDDRVRSAITTIIHRPTLNRGAQSKESVLTHLFAIHTEVQRAAGLGSNTHTIRAAFERAVESEAGRKSAVIWKRFFLFELVRGSEARAKGVFWRAVRACPWVKEIYLLAFDYLGEVMGIGELRGVYEVMVDKELRVHVDLEEAFERLEGRGE